MTRSLSKQKKNTESNKDGFQVSSKQISRTFSEVRDLLGICSDMPPEKRPTFHEIRALSIHLFGKVGIDAQSRAAHKDAKTTQVYKDGHEEWTRVPAAELNLEKLIQNYRDDSW